MKLRILIWLVLGIGAVFIDGVAGAQPAAPAPRAVLRVMLRELTAEAMEHGAVGLSTALTYAPCSYGDTQELIALCEVVGQYGGYFAPHMRGYGPDMEQAVEWLRKGAADQRRKVVFFPPRFRYTFEQMQKDPRMADSQGILLLPSADKGGVH